MHSKLPCSYYTGVSLVKALGNGMIRKLIFSISSIGLLFFLFSCRKPVETGTSALDLSQPSGQIDPMSVNAACYVCHMTFVGEMISKTHFSKGVTCIKCHGVSAGHANDEDIGATKPDVTYSRGQVDRACMKCHKKHKISDAKPARFDRYPVCTDCHGKHRIGSAVE